MKIESETFVAIPRRVEAVHYTQEVIERIFHPSFGRIRAGVLPDWMECAVVTQRCPQDLEYPLVVTFTGEHSLAFSNWSFEERPYDPMKLSYSGWLNPGEWLVRDTTTGKIYSMKNEVFHKTFRALNEENEEVDYACLH